MKYLPWGLAGLLALALIWAFMAQPMGEAVGTVNLTRVVDESARAQTLNQLLSDRYTELISKFDLGTEAAEDDPDRANRERQAYAEYLAYRQQLETEFQAEVDKIVKQAAQSNKITIVVDNEVVRFGGKDLTDEVIRKLK